MLGDREVTRLLSITAEDFSIGQDKLYDSFGWIGGNNNYWKQYISVHVSEIVTVLLPLQRIYVPSKDNPADYTD